MKRIYLLFAIFIILILFVGLTNVSAVDSSKWKIVSIEGEDFKIPPEYEGGELDNDSYKIQNYISALIKQTIIYYIGLEKITHQNI